MNRLLIVILILSLTALACGSSDAPVVVSTEAVQTAIAEVQLTGSAEARALTRTARPPTATRTPIPSNTPRPPTATPQPTATLEPIILTGSGDAIVDFVKPRGPAVVHIIGNAASSHFAVISYGAGNEYLDLLVNALDPYDGYRPLDFRSSEHTVLFEVKARGNWRIEIFDVAALPVVDAGSPYSGSGDYLFWVRSAGDRAIIEGNAASTNFAVWGLSSSGMDLLVNEIDPYSGTVLLDPRTFMFIIQAVGPWTITIAP